MASKPLKATDKRRNASVKARKGVGESENGSGGGKSLGSGKGKNLGSGKRAG